MSAKALARLFKIPRSVIEAAEHSVAEHRHAAIGSDDEHVEPAAPVAGKNIREAFAAADFSPLSEIY